MKLKYYVKSNIKNHPISKTEKLMLADLLDNPHRFVKDTSTDLSKKYFTTTTTINRFAKKCGFTSYTDLKTSIKYLRQNDRINAYTDINDYINYIDFKSIEACATKFNTNLIYYLVGEGASNLSCIYLQRQMLLLGFVAIVVDELALIDASRESCIIAISSSGETLNVLQLITEMKNANHQVFAVTKKQSTLSSLADYTMKHDIYINDLNLVQTEQQIHIFSMINYLIKILSSRTDV